LDGEGWWLFYVNFEKKNVQKFEICF
jgi:hypothetical protein